MDLLAQPGGVGRWADPHPVQRRLEPALGLGKVEAGDRVWRSKGPTHRSSREAASGRLSGPRHRHPGGHVFGALSRGLVPYPPPPTRAHGSCASGSKAGKDRSPPTSRDRRSRSRSRQALERKAQHPAWRLIHRSAWNRYSRKFGLTSLLPHRVVPQQQRRDSTNISPVRLVDWYLGLSLGQKIVVGVAVVALVLVG